MAFDGPSAQRAVSETANTLHKNGWVANHDGNVSLRLAGDGRFLATPTAMSKQFIKPHDLITVDIEGKILSGRKRIFSEWHLHAACFKASSEIRAVIHSHAPHATAFAVANRELGVPGLPEMVVSLGKKIPLISYHLPKNPEQDHEIAQALTEGVTAMIIAGNGVLSVGPDLVTALLRMELVEHYAKILLLSQSLGGAIPLPTEDLRILLAKR